MYLSFARYRHFSKSLNRLKDHVFIVCTWAFGGLRARKRTRNFDPSQVEREVRFELTYPALQAGA